MTPLSRRKFMEKTVISTAGLLAAGASNLSATPLGLPIGSQVWPTRSMLKDFPAYVKMMAGIGVTRLELCSPVGYGAEFSSLANGKEVARVLGDHGMKSESSHFTMGELRQTQQKSIDWAKEVGITQIITATLGGGNNPTLDQVKNAAEEYNKIAAVSAAAGLQQGLHNEGFEMSMVDGKPTYDVLLDLLDPKLVKFQFQMSTITAGFVAAEYFTKYPGRFYSMHLQDINMKASAPAAEGASQRQRYPQVAMGKGSIDWVKTFIAAKIGGVKNYFVEQNWDLTQQSVAYLKTLNV
jgi:sugar phosphate isomerase/epimerase